MSESLQVLYPVVPPSSTRNLKWIEQVSSIRDHSVAFTWISLVSLSWKEQVFIIFCTLNVRTVLNRAVETTLSLHAVVGAWDLWMVWWDMRAKPLLASHGLKRDSWKRCYSCWMRRMGTSLGHSLLRSHHLKLCNVFLWFVVYILPDPGTNCDILKELRETCAPSDKLWQQSGRAAHRACSRE
jgi:hypothetical protein